MHFWKLSSKLWEDVCFFFFFFLFSPINLVFSANGAKCCRSLVVLENTVILKCALDINVMHFCCSGKRQHLLQGHKTQQVYSYLFMVYFFSLFLSQWRLKPNQKDICKKWFYWHREAKCEITTARFNKRLSCSERLLNPLCKLQNSHNYIAPPCLSSPVPAWNVLR